MTNDIPEALRERLRALKTPTLRVERITRETLTADEPAHVEWIVSASTHADGGVRVHSVADLRWHIRHHIELACGELLRAARAQRVNADEFPTYRARLIEYAERYESDAALMLALSREFDTLWPEGT